MKKGVTRRQLVFVLIGVILLFSLIVANKVVMHNKVEHSIPKTSTKETKGIKNDTEVKDETKTDFKVYTSDSNDNKGYSEQVVQDELAGEYDNQVDDQDDEE